MEICEELIEYRKLNFLSSERVKELQLCIGRGYELEAEYQQGSKKPSLFKKARFFRRGNETLRKYRRKWKSRRDEKNSLIAISNA